MKKLLKGILIFTALILSVNIAGQTANADSIDLEPSIIILADRQAIGNAELGEDYFKSIMGLISTLHDGGMLTSVPIHVLIPCIFPAIICNKSKAAV